MPGARIGHKAFATVYKRLTELLMKQPFFAAHETDAPGKRNRPRSKNLSDSKKDLLGAVGRCAIPQGRSQS